MNNTYASKLGWITFITLSAVWFALAWGYIEDDAYIHLVYARNFHEGAGFMFNGIRSNGDTSPLWVLMLSIGGYFTDDWALIAKVLAVFGVAVFAALFFQFAKGLDFGKGALATSMPTILLLLCVINPYFVYWSFSGMECIFACGWLILICLRLGKPERSWPQFLGTALILGCAPLLRPEMIFLVGIGGFFLLKQASLLLKQKPGIATWLGVIAISILIFAPIALWSAYAVHEFGYLLPNTNAAKQAGPTDSVVIRLLQVFGMGFPTILFGVALVFLTLLSRLRGSGGIREKIAALKDVTASQPAYVTPFLVFFVTVTAFYIANHTYVQTRYIMVIAPGMMAIVFALVWKCRPPVERYLILIVSIGAALSITLFLARPHLENKVKSDADAEKMASFINHSIPANKKIAIFSIGEYGYLIKQHIVDIGGITQPEAAQFLFEPTDMLRWAKRQGAEYIIATDSPEANAVKLFEVETVPVGWSFANGFYNQSTSLRIWKLATPE